MRLWPFRRRARKSADIDAALWEADRALRDAKQLRCRADEVTGRLERTADRNHIAEAVIRTIRGTT